MMYDYHINVMKAHYGNKINLMYTDTDSLIYHVKTDDFYKDLKCNSNLLSRMDTSDLPIDHPCYIAERKKIPGLFSDEAKGQPITKFIAIRAKSYAYILNDKEKIKAKGVRGHVVKNHMTFNDHFDCLFTDDKKKGTLNCIPGKIYPSDHSTIRYEQSNPKNYASTDKMISG
ncbi:unnamed protein product [Macrosiphum euphorbiae]|uniref:DNA-directed DNA polymerase n=1 Tax=Macrosiphum euphorbiae TaxID=13131 RepID=A0AAV0XWB1_9HEMI|nr:unnamed protein product [Macrosiphum euphorbiae]